MQKALTIADLHKLYEEDEHLWYFENAKLIREGKVDFLDFEHIAEVLEDMGKRDYREVFSRMKVLLVHLLKWIFQKEYRSKSWNLTMIEQRDILNFEFQHSQNLEKYGKENFQEIYSKARKQASVETGLPIDTFPKEPPFTFNEVLNEDYLPD
ncbi:MAG: DUF29 domain-containing protein [Leptospiraceae bacterium]|nr:DUF29 domain-containing protein [Leptospiraceae bacterium]MCP5502204.1 DUF29 domain-containing protein [Leptospiraceae bacterium]